MRRNIHALTDLRRRFEARRSPSERVADGITRFTGSMLFVYIHAILVSAWILINLDVVPGVRPFDPFPFVMLAMAASVEAIFLSTFVLISQNRMSRLAEQRAELDLQVNLLAEHEITRLIELVDGVAEHLGVHRPHGDRINELKKDVAPEAVLRAIEQVEDAVNAASTVNASESEAIGEREKSEEARG